MGAERGGADIHPRAVSARAVLLGLALIPLNSYWLAQNDMVRATGIITKTSIYYNAVFILFALTAINAAVRRIQPRRALRAGELLVVYAMLSLATAIGGLDFMHSLLPLATYAFRFATQTNQWGRLFLPLLPKWLTVSDPAVLDSLYGGNSTLYSAAHLGAWLIPALAWCGFAAALLWVMMCINVLVRKHWVQSERLTFPLVELPLQMTTGAQSFFRSRLMWVGFSAAAALDLLGGLHLLYPVVPYIDIRPYRGFPLFTDPPWNAVGRIEFGAAPFVLGLGFLMPTKLLFSCWFFYLFNRLQMVAASAIGYGEQPRIPYFPEQTFGAYFGMALVLIWTGRTHWRNVVLRAIGRPSPADDTGEAMRYSTAFFGAILGFVVLVAFSHAAGMTVGFAVMFFIIYFMLSTVLTRLRAELGPPSHDLAYAGPGETPINILGPEAMGHRNAAVSALYWWFNRGYRGHPMPHQLEALKMGDAARLDQRRLAAALVAAGMLATLTTFWALLHVLFKYGESAKIMGETSTVGIAAYGRLQEWLTGSGKGELPPAFAMAAATLSVMLLHFGRLRWEWWPFHPAGFALQGYWMMHHMWFAFFIAWLVKTVVLRYGGMPLYQSAVRLFLGLVLGEFVVAALWSILGMTLGITTWPFWG